MAIEETMFLDGEEIYRDRGYIHKSTTQNLYDKKTLYIECRKLKSQGKEEDEIAHILSLPNADYVRSLLKG
jgi:hypothetical protein